MLVQEQSLANQAQLISLLFKPESVTDAVKAEFDKQQINYSVTDPSRVIVTIEQLGTLIHRLDPINSQLTADLKTIYQKHRIILQGHDFKLDLTDDPAIMAILNTSPDSFFDGDPTLNDKKILQKIEDFQKNDVKIIDIGGQSTRPGYQEITPELEIKRTVPYIKMIKREFPQAIISVDTYKPTVVKAVLDAGADIINDINGFEDSSEKLKLVQQYHSAAIVMYNNRISRFKVNEMYAFFKNRKQVLASAGLTKQNWVIDPGVGFLAADNHSDNDMDLIHQLPKLRTMEMPLLIAISRKSMFKKLFGIDASQNVWSTLVAELEMLHLGGNIIRVHDYHETNLMLKMKKELDRNN